MKKHLLLFFFTSSAITTFSQIGKTQWLMGGNISFSSSKYGEEIFTYKSNDFQISPDVGYFVFDKLAAGGRVSLLFDNSKTIYESTQQFKNTSLSLSPFVRYYFLSKAQKINVFADASYSYSKLKSKVKYSDPSLPSSSSTSKANGYTIAAGPVLFLTPHTAIELTLSYNSIKNKGDDNSTHIFMAGVGFQIHLGKGKK